MTKTALTRDSLASYRDKCLMEAATRDKLLKMEPDFCRRHAGFVPYEPPGYQRPPPPSGGTGS